MLVKFVLDVCMLFVWFNGFLLFKRVMIFLGSVIVVVFFVVIFIILFIFVSVVSWLEMVILCVIVL